MKNDKLLTDELSNPVNDSKKAENLFFDELNAWAGLSSQLQQILFTLLGEEAEFSGFFKYLDYAERAEDLAALIAETLSGRICAHVCLSSLIEQSPVALAYAVMLIAQSAYDSVPPAWVQKIHPELDDVLEALCNTPCEAGCGYCQRALNLLNGLNEHFGYSAFRSYDGEPLQERAAQAALNGHSLLAVFPTGGGKSITFQLPALMQGRTVRGLTVVISPLLSLMKDQVDNLKQKGIEDAVSINSLLNPLERTQAIERVRSGGVSLLYISPELLRSRVIEELLLARKVVRFVIDEAHCFSAWGQDFRVDYLYIGPFMKRLQARKGLEHPIAVSCFTATAKQKVVSDIRDYFRKALGLELMLFTTEASRKNLRYEVMFRASDEEKYATLRALLLDRQVPSIVYCARTKQAEAVAERLSKDGIEAFAFHGKMSVPEKVANQERFIRGAVNVMVATSAFGMGVDKADRLW